MRNIHHIEWKTFRDRDKSNIQCESKNYKIINPSHQQQSPNKTNISTWTYILRTNWSTWNYNWENKTKQKNRSWVTRTNAIENKSEKKTFRAREPSKYPWYLLQYFRQKSKIQTFRYHLQWPLRLPVRWKFTWNPR